MDAYSSKREVERPRTVTQKRAALVVRLRAGIETVNARRKAAETVFGQLSPVPEWLAQAQVLMLEAVDELERSKR